jgi:hypothetical protein
MAQGPWGTGTWDDAQWDSLPLEGNQATGGVGSPSVAVNPALTGVNATGLVGAFSNNLTIGLTGVQASGLAGNETESITVGLNGVDATGSVGTFATNAITIQLTGVQATGAVGDVTAFKPIIYIDDTHDPGPDKRKKQHKLEQEKNKKRRDEIVAAYERIVEGKIPEEIIAPYVETFATIATKQNVTLTDIQKMVSNLDKMQLIWDDHIESDDEEILLL